MILLLAPLLLALLLLVASYREGRERYDRRLIEAALEEARIIGDALRLG